MAAATRLAGLALMICAFFLPVETRADSAAYKALQKQSNGLFKAGKYQQSLVLSQKLLTMAKQEFGDDHTETAMQNFGIGMTLIKLDRAAEAVPFYQKHLAIKEKAYGGKAIGLQFPLNHLAGLYKQLGRLDKAEALYKRVRNIQESLAGRNTGFSARAHGDIAAVNLKRGKWRKALQGYRHSARLYTNGVKKGGALRIAVIDELNDGQIRKNKDVFSGLTRALWELQAIDNKNPQADARRTSEALEAAQWAWRSSAGNALGKMAARLGAGDSALAKRVRALQEASQKITALNKQGSDLLSAMGKAQRETSNWNTLNRAYWQADKKHAPKKRALGQLIYKLERARSTLARQIVQTKNETQKQKLQTSHDGLEKQLNALKAQKQAIEKKLATASKPLDEIRASIEARHGYEAKRQAVLARHRPLERAAAKMNAAIIKDFPGYAELVDPQPLKLKDLQQLLTPDEALLVYLVGKERSFVFAINKTHSSWAQFKSGAAKLAQIVADLRQGLDPTGSIRPTRGFKQNRPDGEQLPVSRAQGLPFDLQLSHDLYQQLIAPVRSILQGKKHVMLVPAGALTALPFQVLVSQKPAVPRPDFAGYRNAAWLIRDHALTVLPSVSSLRALRRFARKGRPTLPFIGYGDPVLEGLGEGDTRSAPPGGFYDGDLANLSQVRQLTPLPDTARELQVIAIRLGVPLSQVRLGDNATETEVKMTSLAEYRLIHFATHGLLAGELQGLAEPALVLTPPAKASKLDDGLLTASEAAQLDLRADWVIMSACNTAAGGKPGAQALSGLARAFFYAGARALLVSHWPVVSSAATELTTSAFAELKHRPKLGRAEAMRRAMLTLMDNKDDPGNAHPSVWAPFIVVGEGGSGAGR